MAEALLVRRGGVSKPKLSSITVYRPPTKTQYDDGESFSRAGMVVIAAYDDGWFLDIMAVASYLPDRALTVGDTAMTISYADGGVIKTTTQPVTVRYLTGIRITTPPTKTGYLKDDTFDPTGMVVTADYSIGPSAPVTGYTFDPSGPLNVADTEITISYTWGSQTKTASLAVNVMEFDPVFENNSWAQIAAVCAFGAVPSDWAVGAEKPFAMNGVPYTAVIIGKNHDNLHADDPKYNTAYNGGTNKAALTLMMKECYATQYRMHSSDTNSVSWQGCEMRTATVPTLIGQLPAALRSALRTVKKLTAQSGNDSTILTTADKLWLLSEVEVWGANNASKPGEGTRYAFYAAGNSRVKNRNGTSAVWWLRSPHSGESANFLHVYSSGTLVTIYASYTGCSVAFGWCM